MNPQQIARYLESKGWNSVTSPSDRLLVFTGFEDDFGQNIELVLPARDNFQDSQRLVESALELIAAVEQVETAELIQRLQHSPAIDRNTESVSTRVLLARLIPRISQFSLRVPLIVAGISLLIGALWYGDVNFHPLRVPEKLTLPPFLESVGLVFALCYLSLAITALQNRFMSESRIPRYILLVLVNVILICLYVWYAGSIPMISSCMRWLGILLPTILAGLIGSAFWEQQRRDREYMHLSFHHFAFVVLFVFFVLLIVITFMLTL